MGQLSQFLAMHGYAAYVWPAFGMTIGALAWQLSRAWRDYARLVKQLKQQRRGKGYASDS